MRLVAILLLLLPSIASAELGFIPTTGANFYCPANPPTGVVCCERKTLDNALLSGTVTQPLEVMECDRGEGFYARIPFPTRAGADWIVQGRVGTSDTNVGYICFEAQVGVTPTGVSSAITLDDALGTDGATNVGIFPAGSTGTSYYETWTVSSGLTMFDSVNQADCTDSSCDGGWITAFIKRDDDSASLTGTCDDTKTGKAWVAEIDWFY